MTKLLQPSLDRVAVNLRSCLASQASNVEKARKALKAIYSGESEELEVTLTITTTSHLS